MNHSLSASSKFMCAAVLVSLAWVLLSGCDLCEPERRKDERNRYAQWVACIDGQPTLMMYFGDLPTTGIPRSDFNPADWDCSHPNSPKYKKGTAPILPSTPLGPLSVAGRRPAAATPSFPYLRTEILDLPFSPGLPPGSSAACDSTAPDVLQTNHTHALVTRVSTCPFAIKAKIPVVSRPLQVEVTPDGTMALVTSFDNAVNFIDLASNRVTFTLTTDPSINPHGIAISPDGSKAYFTNFNSENPVVSVIDMATRKIVSSIRVSTFAQGLTLSPDGSQLWVTHPLGGAVYVIDTLSNTVASFINVSGSVDVAFNSTGTRAYITVGGNPGSVVVVDTATFGIMKTYQVGIGPADISMSPGDAYLVVNNTDGGSISIINLALDKVTTAPVGANPSGIAWVR